MATTLEHIEKTDDTPPVTPSSQPVAGSPEIPYRVLVAVAFPLIASAIMIGGVFTGAGGRVYAVLGGLAGLALATAVSRLDRAWASNVLIAGGLFGIGLLFALPAGFDAVTGLRSLVAEAAQAGDILRPPVHLTAGWQAVIGWLMGTAGLVVGWTALVVRRPSWALLIPVPLAGIGGISVPKAQQVGSGIAVLVLLAMGLGILSTTSSDDDDERTPLRYELQRAIRALPLVAVVTILLYALSRASFLFPPPVIDPTSEPQKPKTTPLSEVEDRVLFEVESSISGPWRIGSLDVYDGADWRLPAFNESELIEVAADGVVDPELTPGVKATFTLAGMSGVILPGLPNTVGIVGRGDFIYDERNGNIRLVQGQLEAGMEYTIAAAALPSVDRLRSIQAPIPSDVARFLEMPDPPPAVEGLLRQAPDSSTWDTFAFLHEHVLANVTAAGQGVPISITPERVQDILAGSKEATPFEIVATEAMLARWAGIPSRIAYGFDGGELVEDRLHVRPKHGATFMEIYFPGFKWLPIISTPQKAKATIGDADEQQVNPRVLPSEDIAVELFVPVVTPPESTFASNLLRGLLAVAGVGLVLLITYLVAPLVRKGMIRSRRRGIAIDAGPAARVALAYAEFRDLVTDYGYPNHGDTPLGFVKRFSPDPDHSELAWLMTRSMWGDLQGQVTDDMAAEAEELSRRLRRRLAQAHPISLRAVAAISRLSLRDPFSPDFEEAHHAA